jgi:hypothetical protein
MFSGAQGVAGPSTAFGAKIAQNSAQDDSLVGIFKETQGPFCGLDLELGICQRPTRWTSFPVHQYRLRDCNDSVIPGLHAFLFCARLRFSC